MTNGYYNKDELKDQIELENIFDLVTELGGEPEYVNTGLVASTICHSLPGEGSRKLYYYTNTRLWHCFTDCDDSFDLFQLVIKAMKVQRGLDWDLHDAMCYVADYFGLSGEAPQNEDQDVISDWQFFKRYDYTKSSLQKPQLKSYDSSILSHFYYPRILSWEDEGINDNVIKENFIGYYPGQEQITIPHFDINGNLIGIRGRFLAEEDARRYGKYRPLFVNKQLYSHPLSMNLYHLNKSKENIQKTRIAIIFESEIIALVHFSSYRWGHYNLFYFG